MTRNIRIGTVALAIVGAAVPVRSQVTEPRGVVGPGAIELEVGVSDSGGSTERTLTGPQVQLRLGTSDRFEFRVRSDGFISALAVSPGGGFRTTGRADATLEGKVALLDEHHAGVELALMPALTMPTGSPQTTGNCWSPAMRVALARALPRGYDASAAVGIWRELGDAGAVIRRSVNAALTKAVSPIVDAFFEGGVATPAAPGASRDASIDAGVIVHSGPSLEFHTQLVRGLTHEAADWSVYASIVVRRTGQKVLADPAPVKPAGVPPAPDSDASIPSAPDRF